MQWGIRIVAGITALAILGLIAVTAAMNYGFGGSFGRTELDDNLDRGAFALSDVLKAFITFVGVDPLHVANDLEFLLATLLELGAGLGLFVALGGRTANCSSVSANPLSQARSARQNHRQPAQRPGDNIVLLKTAAKLSHAQDVLASVPHRCQYQCRVVSNRRASLPASVRQ